MDEKTVVYPGWERNELSGHKKTWRKFECILLSEKSQFGKAMYCMNPTIWSPLRGKTM